MTSTTSRSRPRALRLVAAVVAAAAVVLSLAAPASAHAPVIVGPDDTVWDLSDSPLVPDGTVSFAFYGGIDRLGDTRAVRVRMQEGQQFYAELLIPDQAPENGRSSTKLPRMAVVDPKGRTTLLKNDLREKFFEPFTQTSYVTLGRTTRVAEAGIYSVVVFGATASRFVAVTGQTEQFPAAIENASLASVAQVQEWYRTPPRTTPRRHR